LSLYGNVAAKPYNEETIVINKLLGLTDWMIELEQKNNAFDQLMKSRYDEVSGKTDLKMREVRMQVDTAIRELIDRLNALVLINGIEGYENLISDINTRFEKYEHILLQRQGRSAKNKTVEGEK
jgi:glutathionyl-hydroquinone reductase